MLKTIANAANSLLNTVSGQSNQYSASKELQNAKDIQKMYSDAINTQYAAGIQNLQNQDKTLALQYDPQRALVNSNYERGVRNNEEQMANLGLTRSGTNLTSQLALETERQRGLAEVNAAQDAKRRELQAQINEYIAQRDSAIAQQSASIYQNAYDNISEYQRQLAQMEKQHSYDKEMAAEGYAHDKEMAAISNQYNRDMAALEYEHSLALANNNYDRQLQIEKEMAALEQQYKIETLNRQAEIDKQLLSTEYGLKNSSYAKQAAIDWDYAQKNAALEKELTTDPLSAKYKLQTDIGKSFYNNQIQGGWKPGKKLSDAEASAQKALLDFALNAGGINESDYGYLINIFGL